MRPDTVLRATRLVKTGEVFELGRTLSETMPRNPGRRLEVITKRTRNDPGTGSTLHRSPCDEAYATRGWMSEFRVAIMLAAAVAAADVRVGTQETRPRDRASIRSFGRSTTQYQDAVVKMVASYDYSQRNHDGEWLLVHVGVSMPRRTVVSRDNFWIETWQGTRVPVASHQDVRPARPALLQMIENARAAHLQSIRTYFPESAEADVLRTFNAAGDPVAREAAVLSNGRGVVMGELIFRSAEERWPSGHYRLVFDHERAHAEVPLTLQ